MLPALTSDLALTLAPDDSPRIRPLAADASGAAFAAALARLVQPDAPPGLPVPPDMADGAAMPADAAPEEADNAPVPAPDTADAEIPRAGKTPKEAAHAMPPDESQPIEDARGKGDDETPQPPLTPLPADLTRWAPLATLPVQTADPPAEAASATGAPSMAERRTTVHEARLDWPPDGPRAPRRADLAEGIAPRTPLPDRRASPAPAPDATPRAMVADDGATVTAKPPAPATSRPAEGAVTAPVSAPAPVSATVLAPVLAPVRMPADQASLPPVLAPTPAAAGPAPAPPATPTAPASAPADLAVTAIRVDAPPAKPATADTPRARIPDGQPAGHSPHQSPHQPAGQPADQPAGPSPARSTGPATSREGAATASPTAPPLPPPRADTVALAPADQPADPPADGIARTDPMAHPASSPAHSPTAPHSARPPHQTETARAVTTQIATALPERSGGFELALDPQELGRVHLRLVGTEQGSTLFVQADRPETMDLLRRHIGLLEQDLRALGHESLHVRFGMGQSGQDSHPGQHAPPGQPGRTAAQTVVVQAESPVQPRAAMTADHLDLRL